MYRVIFRSGSACLCDTWNDVSALAALVSVPVVVKDDCDNELLAVYHMDETTALEDCAMSVRTYNCLKRAGCDTLGDAIHHYGLRLVRNLGRKSIAELRTYAEALGVSLWSDKNDLVDLALLGLEALADKKGVDIDNNATYRELCADVTDAQLEGQELSIGYIAAMIGDILAETRVKA